MDDELSAARTVVVVDDYGLAELAVSDHTIYANCGRAALWAAMVNWVESERYAALAARTNAPDCFIADADAADMRQRVRDLLGMDQER